MGLRERLGTTEDRNREKEKRRREKERRRRRAHKYGQAELKASRRGVLSCMFALISIFLLTLAFSVSYISRGDVNLLIGLVGLVAFAMAVLGLLRGIEGLKERNKNYTPCKIGIVCNIILLLLFVATYIRGLF
jgi:hypothetical protein